MRGNGDVVVRAAARAETIQEKKLVLFVTFLCDSLVFKAIALLAHTQKVPGIALPHAHSTSPPL